MIETVGVVGAGIIGRAIAAHAAKGGQRVLLGNRRGPDTLADLAESLGPAVTAVTAKEAATAELVVLAIPFTSVPDFGPTVDWSGRIVVDATNQFASHDPYEGRADTGGLTGSEFLARHLPGATLVKAFNAMYGARVAADPRHTEGRQVVFYAGDDDTANTRFAELVGHWGFAPVYVGPLRSGGRLMQLDGHLSGLHILKQD
ncbi:NAD(P)-binding domain-containing protein [Streptomyces sp. NPDC026672]|uniref:NADPH-dependent F420 reductase n=1 Tax=unclassified Streptomyces TaxID=2593676 RepID=UPI0034063BB3